LVLRAEINLTGGWLAYKSGLTFSIGGHEDYFSEPSQNTIFLPWSRFAANGKKYPMRIFPNPDFDSEHGNQIERGVVVIPKWS